MLMVTMKAADAHNDIGSLWGKATEEPVMIESAGKPRQFGCGRHLLSGAGINVNDLLAMPIDDIFSDYTVPQALQE